MQELYKAALTKKNIFLLALVASLTATNVLATQPPEASLQRQPEGCIPTKGKTPPWMATLSKEEQDKYKANDWYNQWLTTTTSLCTDLSHVKKDNLIFAGDLSNIGIRLRRQLNDTKFKVIRINSAGFSSPVGSIFHE